MKGLIFSVKRYSIHDGPGIRVTFFLKGCPLSCWWCHNPEGILQQPEEVKVIEKVGDMEFIKFRQAGEYYSVDEVLGILEKERPFLAESGGGVTFSGGEPMLQSEFLLEALKACKGSGYHTAVDTSGYSLPTNYSAIIPYTDLFLFDIKHLDDDKHEKFTSVSNTLIINNFIMILDSGIDVMVRIPVIPGFNDDDHHLEKIKSFISENRTDNFIKICLLPYHRIGSSKYKRMNIADRMEGIEPPSASRMNELKQFFAKTGIKVKIGG
jgi:pyruvate formate lyase activating enzyme